MDKITLGRREYVTLPELGIENIIAKIDTGAKTSALHAKDIQTVEQQGEMWVEFNSLSGQGDSQKTVSCRAKVYDERIVKSSNAMKQHRYTIRSSLQIGGRTYSILLSLSDRTGLHCPLLLGREFLNRVAIVDSSKAYLVSMPKTK